MANAIKNITMSALILAILALASCGDEGSVAPDTSVTADFTVNTRVIDAGQSVTFTSTSNTNVDTWQWTFQGGTPATSTEQNPTVTYATAGNFNVSLTVSNSSNSNTKTEESFIGVAPLFLPVQAGFSSQAGAYTGDAISFIVNDPTNISSYEWTFINVNTSGDTLATLTSTEASPSIAFEVAGGYQVSLTAKSVTHEDKKSSRIHIMPGEGHLAHYPLDGNVDEASGDTSGNMHNCVGTTDRNGKENSALALDNSGYIELLDFDIDSEYTMTFFYRKEDTGSTSYWDRFMAKRDDCGNSNFIEMYARHSGDGKYKINFEYNSGSTGSVFMGGTYNLNYGSWTHIAIVYKGNKLYRYTNGQLVNESAVITNPNFSNTAKLGFANTACYGNAPDANRVTGTSIDNVHFYQRALSKDEIIAVYQGW